MFLSREIDINCTKIIPKRLDIRPYHVTRPHFNGSGENWSRDTDGDI